MRHESLEFEHPSVSCEKTVKKPECKVYSLCTRSLPAFPNPHTNLLSLDTNNTYKVTSLALSLHLPSSHLENRLFKLSWEQFHVRECAGWRSSSCRIKFNGAVFVSENKITTLYENFLCLIRVFATRLTLRCIYATLFASFILSQ
jgi:hypothetical protein